MTIVAVSFGIYTLAIVLVGLYSARYAKRSDEDFFLAGRSLGPWVAALSAAASSESGWVTLGLVGWAFTNGVQAYWIIPGCLLGYLFNWFVLAGRMSDRGRELGAVTLPDFFAYHFRERRPVLRILTVVVILVAMLLYVAAQFAAAGKAFSIAFPQLGYRDGVFIGAAIVLVYTVTGGFRAVCWTDFLQALLMVGTLVVFPIYLLIAHAGYTPVVDALQHVTPAGGQRGELLRFLPHATGVGLFGFLLGAGALGINFGYPGQPHVLVRFLALRDRKTAHVAGVVAFVWGLCVYWGAVTVGLFARAMAERGEAWAAAISADSEVGLVVSAMNLLPGVLSGLVLAAVLAAICSTADSQLVVAASAGASDLYGWFRRRIGHATAADAARAAGDASNAHPWVNRAFVLSIGLIAIALVYDQQVRVYDYVLTYGWAILGAAFGPQVILALLWRRATYAGCLAGMLTGFAVALGWKVLLDNQVGGVELYNLTVAFVAALFVNMLVSLLTPESRPGGGDAKLPAL